MEHHLKTFLFAALSTASGASLFERNGVVLNRVQQRPSDRDAMRGDWVKIGKDFGKVIQAQQTTKIQQPRHG